MILKSKQVELSDRDLEMAAEALRILAHPVRLRIVDLLLSDWHSVGELAEALGLPHNAVSQHLSHMRAHRLLDVEREGRTAYYYVVHPQCQSLLDCIRKHPPTAS